MKKTLTAFALIALLPAGAALADDDECRVPRDQWQPREAAMQLAEQNEVKLDPATLQIVEMDYEDEDDDPGGARNPAPAGTVAPPQNGLFGNGAPPQVQVN